MHVCDGVPVDVPVDDDVTDAVLLGVGEFEAVSLGVGEFDAVLLGVGEFDAVLLDVGEFEDVCVGETEGVGDAEMRAQESQTSSTCLQS